MYYLGSSPRVRGSPRVAALYCVLAGIIPAGAGLTHTLSAIADIELGIIPAGAGLT